jgi:hypothetical protein
MLNSDSINTIMNFSERISKVITYFDLYGYPVTLNFQNNDKHRSFLGGVSSIATVVLVVLFFWKAFIELI